MTPNDRRARYVEAALEGAVRDLEAAPPGSRHATVNRVSYRIGGLVGADLLSWGDAKRALSSAQIQYGGDYTEAVALREIQAGLRDGARRPTDIPEDLRGPRTPRTPTAPPRPPPAPAKTHLPPHEVLELWRRCEPVVSDREVSDYLRGRGIDPYAVACCDMARALPVDGIPRWGTYGGRPWSETGHRLILLLWGPDLRPRNVIARRITESDSPKGLSATGYRRQGLCMLDFPAGKTLISGWQLWWPGTPRLVVAEGEIDALAWATGGDPTQYHGTIGIVGGSWSQEWTDKIPQTAKVLVATDKDESGQRYADEILESLRRRDVMTERWIS